MAKTYEWAHNGVWYEIEDDPQNPGQLFITPHQNVKPILDYARDRRNSGENDKVGDFNHYAIIPPVVEVELKKKGIDIRDPASTAKIIKEIETNYPHLKVTNLVHDIRGTG
jgi:hypothetical protein